MSFRDICIAVVHWLGIISCPWRCPLLSDIMLLNYVAGGLVLMVSWRTTWVWERRCKRCWPWQCATTNMTISKGMGETVGALNFVAAYIPVPCEHSHYPRWQTFNVSDSSCYSFMRARLASLSIATLVYNPLRAMSLCFDSCSRAH